MFLPSVLPTSPVMLQNKETEGLNMDYVNGRDGIVPGGFMGRDRNRAGADYNPSFFPRNEHLFKRWVAETMIDNYITHDLLDLLN